MSATPLSTIPRSVFIAISSRLPLAAAASFQASDAHLGHSFGASSAVLSGVILEVHMCPQIKHSRFIVISYRNKNGISLTIMRNHSTKKRKVKKKNAVAGNPIVAVAFCQVFITAGVPCFVM